MNQPDPTAVAVVAAHLAGLDAAQTAGVPASWLADGLDALGLDPAVVMRVAGGDRSAAADLIAFADHLLGDGPIGVQRGSPFDRVRLRAPDGAPPDVAPAAGAPGTLR